MEKSTVDKPQLTFCLHWEALLTSKAQTGQGRIAVFSLEFHSSLLRTSKEVGSLGGGALCGILEICDFVE